MGGMTRLLLLLWAGVTVGSVVDLQKRIIGGKDCSDTERGYHVFLSFTHGTLTSSCGGSLIHKQWILTAAHCWEPGWTIKVVLGRNPQSKTTLEIDPTPWIFEDKDDKGKARQHDIMLLKLLKPAAADIEHVTLPVDCVNKPKVGETVQIAGYYSKIKRGNKKGPGQLDKSKPLQCAKTKVVKCDATICLNASPYTKPLKQLLCYQEKDVDTSPGDSGGGVVFNNRIYGVHVTGDAIACGGAAASMDVCSYKGWIETTTGILWPTQ